MTAEPLGAEAYAAAMRETVDRVVASQAESARTDHTSRVEPGHPSGKRLIDNHAPYGDAVLPLPAGGTVCAVSTVTGAVLAQMIVAEVLRRLLDAGEEPPVYLSKNVPGGDDHNETLEARYAGRIRRTA